MHHYHPTISLLARQLLASQPLSASADLSLNTLSHFLDRFVYKNAKKTQTAKGVSAMQPAASGLDGTGVKLMKGDHKEARVNDEVFALRREQDVPVDEVFFHRFFTRKNEKKQRNGKKVEESGDEDEDEGEEEDEDEEEDDEGSGSDVSDGDEEMDLTGDEAAAGDDDDEGSDDEEEDEIWKVRVI